jgi:hypothetical protein
MERKITVNTKKFNKLGQAYNNSSKAKKLLLRSSLMVAGESEGVDLWRSFREVWQYSETYGKAPYLLISTVIKVLNLDPNTHEAKETISPGVENKTGYIQAI